MSLLFTHQGLSHYNEKDQTCWSAERSGDSCLANLDDFLKRAHKRKKYICMHLLLDLGNFHYYENCYLDISFKLILIPIYFLIAYFFSYVWESTVDLQGHWTFCCLLKINLILMVLCNTMLTVKLSNNWSSTWHSQ